MAWSCSACTYSNANMASQSCEICGTARPKQAAPAATSAKAPSVPSGWACHQCTFVNVPSATQCAICEALRAVDAMMIDDEKMPVSPISTSRHSAIDLTESTSPPTKSAAEKPVKPAEHSMKLPKEAEASRRLAEAQAREKERIEHERSRKLKLKEQRMRDLVERKAEVERERQALAKKKEAERLESTKQLFEMQERHQAEIRAAREKRDEIDRTLKDIPSAVRYLHQHYGMEGVKDVLLVVSKIIFNIIASPEDPKFRRIPTSSASFKNRIESRVGGTGLMKLLGFQYQYSETELGEKREVLLMESPNISFLKAEYEKMMALLNRPETKLHQYLPALSENEDITVRFLVNFRKVLDNIAVAPSSSVAGKIDVRSDAYKAFFGPFQPSEPIFKEFRFEFSDPFWSWHGKDISLLQKGVCDMDKEIAKRLPNCSISKALIYVNAHNSKSATISLVTKVQTVLTNLINDMHQTRHHVVPLQPLIKLTGPIDGLGQLLVSLGFLVDPEMKFARVPYPYEFGIEPYRTGLDIVERTWNRISKPAK